MLEAWYLAQRLELRSVAMENRLAENPDYMGFSHICNKILLAKLSCAFLHLKHRGQILGI